jgi:hypothetical protein
MPWQLHPAQAPHSQALSRIMVASLKTFGQCPVRVVQCQATLVQAQTALLLVSRGVTLLQLLQAKGRELADLLLQAVV